MLWFDNFVRAYIRENLSLMAFDTITNDLVGVAICTECKRKYFQSILEGPIEVEIELELHLYFQPSPMSKTNPMLKRNWTMSVGDNDLGNLAKFSICSMNWRDLWICSPSMKSTDMPSSSFCALTRGFDILDWAQGCRIRSWIWSKPKDSMLWWRKPQVFSPKRYLLESVSRPWVRSNTTITNLGVRSSFRNTITTRL